MSDERTRKAKEVTWVGFFCNLILTAAKLAAGIFGKSSAMVADSIHSLSDFLTDLIVLCFIGISGKGKDENHDYGHGKYETFATLLVSTMLVVVGVGLFYQGGGKIHDSIKGAVIGKPTYLALIAAVISIVVKELLYWYTYFVGKKIKSDAVVANAWHHRSDALSSIGTLLGISGAMFLGENFRILDPLACLVVSIFIVIAGIKLLLPAVKELLESSLSDEIESNIFEIIINTPGVKTAHNLKTRKNGSYYIIDVHIRVEPEITVREGHDISHLVEKNLREKFGAGLQTSIHIEPARH